VETARFSCALGLLIFLFKVWALNWATVIEREGGLGFGVVSAWFSLFSSAILYSLTSGLVASWPEKQLVKEAAGHRLCLAQLKLVYKLLTINISYN
jgi:hypothetical protein